MPQAGATDSLARALRQVFARPEYHWTERRHPLQWLSHGWRSLVEWLDRLSSAHPLAIRVFWVVLVLVLVTLLAHLSYTAWAVYRATVRRGGPATGGGAPLLADARSHLARADALARAGRYAEALAYRFLAVVLELEHVKAVKFHPSKTPAEYVAEARLDDAGKGFLARLVATLYRHLFGAEPVDAAEYAAFGDSAQVVIQHVLPG
ncbi:MAG TPA: DUF4129 domain-containing protein [Gemmatimonadales bacterium]|nr:DUF4129 domain-containing protein [Gemmatimonadales bacterium]